MGKTLEELEEEQKDQIRSGKIGKKSAKADAIRSRLHHGLLSSLDVCANTPLFLFNNTLGPALGRYRPP